MNDTSRSYSKKKQDVVRLLFITFCCCLCQNSMNSVLAVYIDSMGYSTTMSGYMSLSFTVFAIILRLAAGFYSDTVSRRNVLVFGCLLFSLSALFFGLVPLIGLLVLFRGLQGGGYSIAHTATSAVCADLAPKGKLTVFMNLFWGVNTITIGCSGFIAQFFISANKHQGAFYMACVVMVAALLISLSLRYESNSTNKQDKPARIKRTAGEMLHSVIDKKSLPAFLILFIIGLSHSAPAIYVFVYAQSLGYNGLFGPYNLVAAIFMVIGNFVNPIIMKKIGFLPLLVAVVLLFGVSLAFLTTGRLVAFYFEAACFGLLIGVTFPMLNMLGVEGLPFNRRGAGSGTVLLALDFGVGVGGFVFGALITAFSFDVTFFLAASCTLVAAALAIVLFRKRNSRLLGR